MKQQLLISALVFAVFMGAFQSSYAQQTKELTKDEAIKRLTELTMPMLDEKKLLKREKETFEKFAKQEKESIEKESGRTSTEEDIPITEEDIAPINKALKENKKLTNDQKAFVKENYEGVIDIVTDIILQMVLGPRDPAEIVKNYIKDQERVVELFEKSLAKNFNAGELNELVGFFESSEGKKVIKFYNLRWSQNEFNYDTQEINDPHPETFEAFTKTALGKRFDTSYVTDSYDSNLRDIEISPDSSDSLDNVLDEAINKYVAENYDPDRRTQKSGDDVKKIEAAKKLTELSYPIQIYASPKYVLREKMLTPEALKNMFDEILKSSNEFTSEEKSFLKANYKDLIEVVKRDFNEMAKADNNLRVKFAKESFEKSAVENLDIKQINELIMFFQTSEGEKAVKMLFPAYEPADAERDFDEDDPKQKELQAQLKKFEESPIGINYFKIMSVSPVAQAAEKLEQATKQRGGALIPSTYPAYIEKIFGQFVTENYDSPLISENREFIKRVEFARGKSSVTLSNSVIRGDRDTYIVRAKKGQKMSVKITALENNAAFTIAAPGKRYMEKAGELDDQTSWTGTLPTSGDYKIKVGGTRGNATYKLTVTIK